VAIVDFGLGNLFSVERACEHVGVPAAITDDPDVVRRASGLVLPGVGAFGDAMAVLRSRGLDAAVLDRVQAGVPVLGVCLGMQLLLRESEEFGRHTGLGVLDGVARPLRHAPGADPGIRVPHIGWSAVDPSWAWHSTPLADVAPGSHFYFVHSYFADLADAGAAASWTTYGGVRFCSSVQVGSVFACQFHPERSGPVGLSIYRRAFADVVDPVGAP
jgi:glutamine amidotransferase